MPIRRNKWMAAAFLASTVAVAAAQDDGAKVSGRVTNSVTGAPIRRAQVRLTHWAQKIRGYGVLTDDDGKFSIAQLPAGQYSFTAEAAGFEPPRDTPDDPRSIELKPGEHRGGFSIALIPWGTISGRVLDAEGRPVQGVSVAALGLDGFVSYQTSDPRGEYRMPRLSPGRYRVRAAPETVHLPPEIRSDGTTEMRYASTYYPDSLTPQSAAPLDILPGAERTGVDIRLVRAPIVAVRGTVSGMEAGIPAFLDIRKDEPPRGPGPRRFDMMRFGDQVNTDGSFVIWGLDPGIYQFVGHSNDASSDSAPVDVTVAGKDVNGVHLDMMRRLTITGRVVLAEAAAQLPSVSPEVSLGRQKQLSLHDVEGIAFSFAVVADDGTFHLDNVESGRYSVRMNWGPYVQSMRLGSTDLDGELLDLRNRSDGAALTLYASSATGEIAGVVHNSGGPVAHTQVVLLEEGTGGWPWVIRTSSDSRYSFPNLRPGKYRLVVLDGSATNAMALRFQMFDYADIVETIELGAGERVTRDLRQHDGK